MSSASRVLYLFRQSLTARIPRLHGLEQVVALCGDRPFSVMSFEPRRGSRTREDALSYDRVRSWLRSHGIAHTPLPMIGTRWLEVPLGALAVVVSFLFGGTRIVHARSYVPGLMALLAAQVVPVRLLFDMRGLFVDEYLLEGALKPGSAKLSFARWLERRLILNADAIIVVSERFRSHLLTRSDLATRIDPARLIVIPNRVDLSRFEVARPGRKATREARGWSDSLVFIYVGSTARWHRLDATVELMAGVLRAAPESRLVVSAYSDTDYVRRLSVEAGLPEDRVEVFSSSVEDIPELLSAADVGLMLVDDDVSKQVCAPVKFSEYMAAGLPVIAGGGIGDTRDWIEAEGLGLLVDIDDPAGAAQVVLESLSEGGLASADARRRCLDFARRSLDMRETLKQYEAVYRELETR